MTACRPAPLAHATEALAPNWNVASTNGVWAVLERTPHGEDTAAASLELRPLRWGLVPSWAKEPKIGAQMINARVETVPREAGLPSCIRQAPLPAPGGRLLRVAAGHGPATSKARKQPCQSPASAAAGALHGAPRPH